MGHSYHSTQTGKVRQYTTHGPNQDKKRIRHKDKTTKDEEVKFTFAFDPACLLPIVMIIGYGNMELWQTIITCLCILLLGIDVKEEKEE